jgi:hypothetical protein
MRAWYLRTSSFAFSVSQASSASRPGSLSKEETQKAEVSESPGGRPRVTDESERARGRHGVEVGPAEAGNEMEGESGEGGGRTAQVTDRRMFLIGGVGGVAIQVGRTRERRWSEALLVPVVAAENFSAACMVEVGVQTGDALIGGIGRKPDIVSLSSGDGEGWRKDLRSRIEGSMVQTGQEHPERVPGPGQLGGRL